MKIGYIGLGAMGGALARRLLKTYPLQVWDLLPAALERFAQLGATPAASPAALARECDVVMTCLPRSSNLNELLFGRGGLAAALSPGKIVIDQTSGNPDETAAMARSLSEIGVALLDAPVSGGQRGAEAGTIAIMVAGPQETYERARPVLQAISSNVDYCGPRVGDAHALKLVNNTMSGSSRLATWEIVAVGRKLGLSLETLTQAINQGESRNRASMISLPALLQGKPAVSDFALELLVKDINLGTSLGMKCGAPMLLSNLVRSYHEMALNTLGRGAQLEQLVGVVEAHSGTRLMDATVHDASVANRGRLAKLVATAVAACNRLLTYECAALGFKYGLPLDLLARVINKGGAWNGASELILPALSSGATTSDVKVGSWAEDLKALSELAKGSGAPMTVGHLARGLVEAGANQLGPEAGLDELARVFESLAGVRFNPSRSSAP